MVNADVLLKAASVVTDINVLVVMGGAIILHFLTNKGRTC